MGANAESVIFNDVGADCRLCTHRMMVLSLI